MSRLKVLAVSDKVLTELSQPEKCTTYSEIDLLIGCGDLPFYYLNSLVTGFNAPLLYVRGNHDAHRQYSALSGEHIAVRDGINMHGHVLMEQGLSICGVEGSMRYQPQKAQQYTELEMMFELIRMGPRLLLHRAQYQKPLDIFIAHSPPFGIHDEQDRPHQGFKVFHTFLRLFKPKYMLHGHIHRYDLNKSNTTQFGETTIINVYPSHIFEIDVGSRG